MCVGGGGNIHGLGIECMVQSHTHDLLLLIPSIHGLDSNCENLEY